METKTRELSREQKLVRNYQRGLLTLFELENLLAGRPHLQGEFRIEND